MSGKPLCIIPARAGSKRFPGKNIALLNGKPLLAYAIEAAESSGVFDSICVSSDSSEILAIAKQFGADQLLVRSAALATDTAQVRDVCRAILEEFKAQAKGYELFAVLLATNPLRNAGDIRAAFEFWRQSQAEACLSVVAWDHPPQRAVKIVQGRLKPAFGIESMKPAQVLEPLYRHDGSMIFAKSSSFLASGQFYMENAAGFLMPRERSVDIDTPDDFVWAEFLLRRSTAVPVSSGSGV